MEVIEDLRECSHDTLSRDHDASDHLSDVDYAVKNVPTRRDRFQGEIEAVTSWSALLVGIEPCFPKGEDRGRTSTGLEWMRCMYVPQHHFGWSYEGIEDAHYDSQAIRRSFDINLNREFAPNCTTLPKSGRLLEKNVLIVRIFVASNVRAGLTKLDTGISREAVD